MMKDLILQKFKTLGLPGGPNEVKIKETVAVSTTGYKRDSKDVNNSMNIIPSNRITMKNVDFPVYGISNTGDERIMYPGEEHSFDGDYVIEKPYMQKGGPQNTSIVSNEEIPELSESQMKAKMAYEAALGNKAAQRMLSLNPKTYDFGNGRHGTHFMASMDEYAVPLLQDKGGNELEYNENPIPSKEDFKFNSPKEANYFTEHYKEVAPMIKGEYQKGGSFIEKELTDSEIEDLKRQGYRIEFID